MTEISVLCWNYEPVCVGGTFVMGPMLHALSPLAGSVPRVAYFLDGWGFPFTQLVESTPGALAFTGLFA